MAENVEYRNFITNVFNAMVQSQNWYELLQLGQGLMIVLEHQRVHLNDREVPTLDEIIDSILNILNDGELGISEGEPITEYYIVPGRCTFDENGLLRSHDFWVYNQTLYRRPDNSRQDYMMADKFEEMPGIDSNANLDEEGDDEENQFPISELFHPTPEDPFNHVSIYMSEGAYFMEVDAEVVALFNEEERRFLIVDSDSSDDDIEEV